MIISHSRHIAGHMGTTCWYKRHNVHLWCCVFPVFGAFRVSQTRWLVWARPLSDDPDLSYFPGAGLGRGWISDCSPGYHWRTALITGLKGQLLGYPDINIIHQNPLVLHNIFQKLEKLFWHKKFQHSVVNWSQQTWKISDEIKLDWAGLDVYLWWSTGPAGPPPCPARRSSRSSPGAPARFSPRPAPALCSRELLIIKYSVSGCQTLDLIQIYQSEIKQIVVNPLLRPMIEVIPFKLFKIVKLELKIKFELFDSS